MNKNKQLELINKECPAYAGKTTKRELRHEFFKNINTELQAYLLGFHAADGSINLERHTLRVKVTKTDSEIIDLFKESISPNAYTRDVVGFKTTIREKEVNCKPSYEISIASKILTDDIINLGFGPNKTYSELHLPKIKIDLIKHFIRGYFDGDGCFTFSVRKPNLNNRQVNYSVQGRFEICCKKVTILEEIKSFFECSNINLNINYIKRDDMYRLCTSSKEEIIKIFNLLYVDSNFYLKRKFEKFNYYVNTEVSQIITDHRNA